jgi:D-serine deaminase-like pyridoxal phosphate-dependent protein
MGAAADIAQPWDATSLSMNPLDTPVALVDLDRLEANITRLQQYLDRHGIANRPHIKTHKIPDIAHMQLKAGAAGIACQKLGEVEVMAGAGIENFLVPYNIVGQPKLERLMKLARRVKIAVTADSVATVRGLSEAARESGVELPVLVEFDSGAHRCGVQTPAEAAELARTIDRSPSLKFGGLMTYPTSDATGPFVNETKTLLERSGLQAGCVSGGGTACMGRAHEHPEVTEHRAGMYVFGDRNLVNLGAMRLEDCALKVLTTVVSRPTADRGILDAGSKSLSSDLLGQDGYGLVLEYPAARIVALSEEHAHVDVSQCTQKPEIGEQVSVLPNHCCVVVNLFKELIGIRHGKVEIVWPVAARGAVQ